MLSCDDEGLRQNLVSQRKFGICTFGSVLKVPFQGLVEDTVNSQDLLIISQGAAHLISEPFAGAMDFPMSGHYK